MSPPTALSAREYQQLPQVAARVREFCGLDPERAARCVYVAGMGPDDGPHATWNDVPLLPPDRLAALLVAGKDVGRSMWDTASLLVYVDLDFRNGDAAGEVYLHPADAFLKLEPTYRAFWASFDELGLPMLDLMTGAGYGLLGRIPIAGAVAARLGSLAGTTPSWHATHAERRPAWAGELLPGLARAHHGLGLALEYLLHRTLRRAASASPIPVVVNNADIGIGPSGREAVSIDLTHMGDPLDSRHVRVAFGAYQKHRLRPDLMGPEAARRPPLAVIPRRRRPLFDVLEERGLREAAEAATTRIAIPDVEPGLARLLDEYEASGLARWHRDFIATPLPSPAEWPRAYDRIDLGLLPPCVAASLEHANDLLLKPAHIQLLVRTLLARGWQARRVAGLVWSRYARPGVWGEHWRRADPRTRAEFDVRVYAGLIAMGLDEGVDLNCVSTQEKGMCPGGGCPFDLRHERDRLLRRS